MKIQLGSGDKYWPGWVNVDKHTALADVHSDCLKIPFETETADEIHAIHLLEHIQRIQAEDAVRDWLRVLKKGGKLVLELPCLDKICKMYVDGEKNMRLTLLGLYGDPRDTRPGMEHQWGWGKEEITHCLREAGFKSVEVMEPKFHIAERDMRVEAVK